MIIQGRLTQILITSNISRVSTSGIHTCVKLSFFIRLLSVCVCVHGTCLLYGCIIREFERAGREGSACQDPGSFSESGQMEGRAAGQNIRRITAWTKRKKYFTGALVALCTHRSKPAHSNFVSWRRKDLESFCAEKQQSDEVFPPVVSTL